MIRQHLLHTPFLLCLLFQCVQVLQEQIADVVRWLEVKRQHTMGREDAQEYLDPLLDLLDLLDLSEPLIHDGTYPCWNRLALFMIALALGGDMVHIFLSDPLRPPL